MNFTSLQQLLSQEHLPAYHLQTLISKFQSPGFDYSQLSSWPASLRQKASQIPLHSYTSATQIKTGQSGAKAMLSFGDNTLIETVLIPTKPDHYSVCISCQSGCAMGCTFCATGSLGLTRSLTTEEITDQFLYWRHTHPDLPIKSIVFMGMGEPFANLPAVFTAINWLNKYFGLGYRHLTISTCGLPQGILDLANTYPQVNLAISLHAANQSLRQQLMPIATKISLDQLAQAITKYFSITNRQVTFEYLLLSQINDTPEHLDQLITWLNQFPLSLVHVNLIGFNVTTDQFTRPSNNRIQFCLNYLRQHQVSATIRKSFGQDIAGACGQLALKGKL